MYNYRPQLPNMNTSIYVPRGVLQLNKTPYLQVDRSFLQREDGLGNVSEYIPWDAEQVVNAVWLSAVINANVTKTHDAHIKAKPHVRTIFRGETEAPFADFCREGETSVDLGSLYGVVSALNRFTKHKRWAFSLNRIDKWDNILVALGEGYTVMVGCTAYESFLRAERDGIVPMPKPQEDLLGGQMMNLVAFDQKKRQGTLWGNRGKIVGRRGLFFCHDSYLRNLDICRDFFVLIPRILHEPTG